MSRLLTHIQHGPYAQGAEIIGQVYDLRIVRCVECGQTWGLMGQTNMDPGRVVFASRPFAGKAPCGTEERVVP